MKSIELEFPYDEFVGYIQTIKNRRYLYLYNKETNKRKLISLARYLVSINERRILSNDEHVDHIDGDFKNDNLNNLQILSHKIWKISNVW